MTYKQRMRWRCGWLPVLGLLLAMPAVAEQTQRKFLEYQGARRVYHEFVPDGVTPQERLPVLFVLHGSGSDGRSILKAWTRLAQSSRFIVVAPDAKDSRGWQIRADGPRLFYDLAIQVAAQHAVELERIYLFGHSGGASYALTLAVLESAFFAAAAAHAGAWREPREYAALSLAKRKIAIAMFGGDRDPLLPRAAFLHTVEALDRAQHPVQASILPRHGHDYGQVAAQVNQAAWEWMREHRLEQPPTFQSYE